jgi:hypothetical protein
MAVDSFIYLVGSNLFKESLNVIVAETRNIQCRLTFQYNSVRDSNAILIRSVQTNLAVGYILFSL